VNESMKADKPTSSVVTVDPATAERWLGYNHSNRNVRQNLVDCYARDMEDGNWEMTGEPVKFATDGRLLDGQHRLHAIVKSGVTLNLLVVRGLPTRAQLVMDSGARRTAADALAMDGRDHSTFLSSGARVAIGLSRGSADNLHSLRITHAEIRTFVDSTPAFVEAVGLFHGYSKAIASPKGVLAYVAWRLCMVDATAAKEFFDAVASQEMLRGNDPRMVLAKRLYGIRESRVLETVDAYVALFFRAWNHWREGSSISMLKTVRPVSIPQPK
jgi:hypothetical protein